MFAVNESLLGQLADVHFHSMRDRYGPLPDLSLESRRHAWEQFLSDPRNDKLLLQWEGSSLCGFAMLRTQQSRIFLLYVHPDYQGRGYGKRLLHRAVALCESPWLYVLARNTQARAFYEAMGFSATGESRMEDLAGQRELEVRYQLVRDTSDGPAVS